MSHPRLVALLLALITLLVYLPVTHDDFLCYDDEEYVTHNRVVQHGLTWAGVEWAFTTFHTGNWHPVTWLSHMADCTLFGLNAGAHHFVNALLHATNAALLFLLLWRLTRQIWPSALVAALFAWHPLHVESVAWIAERKDVLSTGFALLTLLSYVKFVQENCRSSYWFALVFFALGLLAKTMLVTLPLILLLLDYWPLARFPFSDFRRSFWSEKIPFFLLAAIFCVMTVLAQHSDHAIASLGQVSLAYRFENATVATVLYLLKIVWPADLAIIYPFTKIPLATVVAAVVVLVLISITVWRARLHNRCWLVGWLWFFSSLVPVIGLVQVGHASMADRYTYIPSIGIFIAIAFGLQDWFWAKKFFPVGAVLLVGVCALLTERQLVYWRDSETLFRHAIAVTPDNEFAHLNLGVALEQQGRTTEALAEYREVVRCNPSHYQIHFSIGNMLQKMGQPAAALVEYRQCLRLNPEIPALHNAAGCAQAAQGNFADALTEFAEAERLDSHYSQPHIELAKIYFRQGEDTQAKNELQAAAQAEPYDFQTLATVAHHLAADENADGREGHDALVLALKANELSDSRQPEVLDVLGMAFAETGDYTNAAICVQNALALATAAQMQSTGAMQQRLELYQQNRPWRESFRATNTPAKN
jgi:protein O-mannosyl-transferase